MKAWAVRDEEYVWVVQAETRGKARWQHARNWDADEPLELSVRRCEAMDGLDPESVLDAFRVGLIANSEGGCPCGESFQADLIGNKMRIYGAYDDELPVVYDGELYCYEGCDALKRRLAKSSPKSQRPQPDSLRLPPD